MLHAGVTASSPSRHHICVSRRRYVNDAYHRIGWHSRRSALVRDDAEPWRVGPSPGLQVTLILIVLGVVASGTTAHNGQGRLTESGRIPGVVR